jgi:hypothetical protein
MTGIALGWIGATIPLASVVRKPNNSCSPSMGALFGPLTPRERVHRPPRHRVCLASADRTTRRDGAEGAQPPP